MQGIANPRRPPRRAVVLVHAIGMGLVLLPVSANASAIPEATVRKLQRQLEERDAIIRDLLRRVGELERRTGEIADNPAPTQPAPRRAAVSASKPVIKSSDAVPSPVAAHADGEPAAAQRAPSIPTPETKPSAPGQVTATEEEAERALERTLTATGALLLPYGQIELEPSFTYTRMEDKLGLFTSAGPLELRLRRNVFEQALGTRVGLPLDAQAELRLPYGIVQQQVSLGDVGDSRTGTGLGNLSVGLAKTVLRETGWQPDLITRLTWNAPTGESEDDNVALTSGSGFNQLRGEVVALKRQDPLAFVLSAAYETTFNKINGTEPGDRLGFSLGAFLATSPETSLNLSLQQTFSDDVRRDGRVVNESGQTQSVLNIGISSILGKQVLLNLLAGVGLTDDAPDYSVMLSLPIRFGIPVP
jgi:Putative MetA-pathway of phenol degradation